MLDFFYRIGKTSKNVCLELVNNKWNALKYTFEEEICFDLEMYVQPNHIIYI